MWNRERPPGRERRSGVHLTPAQRRHRLVFWVSAFILLWVVIIVMTIRG